MKQPLVSVIVPVYRTREYLRRCVRSVLDGALSDLEVILVDDGCPQGSGALCDELACEDERIRVIHQENRGLGMARNAGIESARGKYLSFVDSDDAVLPEMLSSMVSAAEAHGAELVISGICFVGGNMFDSSEEKEDLYYFEKETLFQGDGGRRELMLGIAGAPPEAKIDCRFGASVCKNLFLRQTVTDSGVRFLSERKILSEDTLFLLDLIPFVEKAVGIPRADYLYYRNGESLSKAYRPDRLSKSLLFVSEVRARLDASMAPEEYEIYLDRLLQAFARVISSQEIVHAKEAGTTKKELRARLAEIACEPSIRAALRRYPIFRLPAGQAAFAFATRHRLYALQRLLVFLRER